MFFLFKPFVAIGKGFKFVFGKTVYKGAEVMKNLLIAKLVGVLISMLTPDLLKKFVDQVLDFVENYVKGTKSELDDKIVLPLCEVIRNTFDVPDND
jgi:hypothetical protein